MTHGGPPKKGEIDFSFLGIGILHVDQEKIKASGRSEIDNTAIDNADRWKPSLQ